MAIPSTLNPWKEKGIPLEQQYRSWKEIAQEPFNKNEVDAYTRVRVIMMNGVEIECWVNSHNFARMTENREILTLLAQTRRVDQQQQSTINGLNPGDQTVLETTVAYEQVAIDLTAYLARNEPDPYLREVLNFGLLEDFDHLYRYSELLDYIEGKDPDTILQGNTEVLPGRPTSDHHNAAELRLLKHYEKNRALPLSKIHVLTVLAAEQQTYNYYKNHGDKFTQPIARQLYAEIGEVEEEHVTQYESLIDPTETLIERQVLHELTEVYNYFHCMEQETDPRIKRIWEQFLNMEIEHLHLWGEMLWKYEGREPQEVFGEDMVVDLKLQSNKEYIRAVLDKERDIRLLPNGGFAHKSDLPAGWPSKEYQLLVNRDGVPSEEVVDLPHQNGRAGDDMMERARAIAHQVRTV